jgi:MarR family transcriptional regulator, transcriptional regulator for hemolysin
MDSQKQAKRGRKFVGLVVPTAGARSWKALGAREWRKDLLVSWLFRTCIKLQTSFDRRFLRFGMTVQEASVLLRCVQAGKVTPGRLAVILGRDKGKITRFVDRLEASRLVTRDSHRGDRRFSVIKPTGKGKQVARALSYVFDDIRKELFLGISEQDVQRLGRTILQLHKNATQIGTGQKRGTVRRRRRIATDGLKAERPQTSEIQAAQHTLTHFPDGPAGHVFPIEPKGAGHELVRHEQAVGENTSRGKALEEHEGLILK